MHSLSIMNGEPKPVPPGPSLGQEPLSNVNGRHAELDALTGRLANEYAYNRLTLNRVTMTRE